MNSHFIKVVFCFFLLSSCGNEDEKTEADDEIAKNYEKISNSLSIKLSSNDSIINLGDSINFKVLFFSNDKIIPDSMYETRYIIDSIFDPEWPWDSITHPYFISENNVINILAKDSGRHFISIHCLYNSDAGFNKVINHFLYVNGKSSNL